MADNDSKETKAAATPSGETDAEKAERETRERERNQAEATVKGWVKEAIGEQLSALKPTSTSSNSETSRNQSQRRRSILEMILR